MGVPRTRGDGPNIVALAGNAQGRVPRTRGDGPPLRGIALPSAPCSPHTRGWTEALEQIIKDSGVFPAHAGMDRIHARNSRRGRVFPAHAGMDRSDGINPCPCIRVPRTRGDGPIPFIGDRLGVTVFPAHAGMDRSLNPAAGPNIKCSPHTRGWTVQAI